MVNHEMHYSQMKDFKATLISLTSSTLKEQTLEGTDHWVIFHICLSFFKVVGSRTNTSLCAYSFAGA